MLHLGAETRLSMPRCAIRCTWPPPVERDAFAATLRSTHVIHVSRRNRGAVRAEPQQERAQRPVVPDSPPTPTW